jgi:hypothetical protein
MSSGVLYRMAKLAYERTKSALSETAPNQDDALTALLFSTATLEAFIVELAHNAEAGVRLCPSATSPVPTLARVLDEVESSRGSVRLKYLMAKAILSGESYLKCGNKDTISEYEFRNLRLIVSCPECKQVMTPTLIEKNYSYLCEDCQLYIWLSDLLPHWEESK